MSDIFKFFYRAEHQTMSSIRSFSSILLLALLPLGFLIVMVVAPLVALAFYDGSAWGGVLRDDYMQHLILWDGVSGFWQPAC